MTSWNNTRSATEPPSSYPLRIEHTKPTGRARTRPALSGPQSHVEDVRARRWALPGICRHDKYRKPPTARNHLRRAGLEHPYLLGEDANQPHGAVAGRPRDDEQPRDGFLEFGQIVPCCTVCLLYT